MESSSPAGGVFDPSPHSLRLSPTGRDPARLDSLGRNLPQRLQALKTNRPAVYEQIRSATQSVLGIPVDIDFFDYKGPSPGVCLLQIEPGLVHPIFQWHVSSGTLRMLALMTALFGETESSLIGIEEPENYVHPTALAAFAKCLKQARDRVQILVTTHSPLLLDFLD